MQVTAITTEQFVVIHQALTNVTDQSPNSITSAYSGTHSEIGDVIITSDPTQCLLIAENVVLKPVLAITA